MHMCTSACTACTCKQARCDSNSRARLHTVPPPRVPLVCASVCHEMRSNVQVLATWHLACMDPTTARAILRVHVNKQVAWPAHTEKLLSRGPCLDKESELMCTRASRTWDKIMRAAIAMMLTPALPNTRLATHWPYIHRATHLAIAMHGDSCWARRSSPDTLEHPSRLGTVRWRTSRASTSS
jgi:hypothetical protein